jgi:hypothetical protein
MEVVVVTIRSYCSFTLFYFPAFGPSLYDLTTYQSGTSLVCMHLLLISVTYVKAITGADNAGDQGTNTYYSGCTDTDHSNAVQRCCSDSCILMAWLRASSESTR